MSEQKTAAISRLDSIRTRLILAFVSVVLLPMIVISAMLAISESEGAQKHLAVQWEAKQMQTEYGQTTRVLLAVNGSVALAAIFIAVFASLSVTHSIAMPLADLSETAARIASGSLDLTAAVKRKDEIGALAQTFNFMTDQLRQTMEGLRNSEEQYRTLVDNVNIGIYRNTPGRGGFIQANPAMYKMFGYGSVEEFRKIAVTDLYQNSEDRKRFLEEVKQNGFVKNRELAMRKKDGTPIWCSATAAVHYDEQHEIKWMDGVLEDITERKQSEEALRKAHEELETRVKERTSELSSANEQLHQRHEETSILYEVSSVISQTLKMEELLAEVLKTIARLELFAVDKGGIFIIEGDRMRMIANVGHSDAFLQLHKDMKVGDCLCGSVAKTGEIIVCTNSAHDARHTIVLPGTPPHGHLVVPLKTKDRVEGVLDLYIPVDAVIDDSKIRLMQSIGNQLGIAIQNARLYEATISLSLHDSLTGLWNHEEIHRILEQELARAEREGTSVAVIMADLDHFKKVNDSYGHIAGDTVLRVTAESMRSLVRPYDAVGRYGGEEFLIVLPGCDAKHVAAVAERFRKRIGGERINTQEGMIPITVSMGVAASDKAKRRNMNTLVRAADSALYRAKENGRNRVEFAPDDE